MKLRHKATGEIWEVEHFIARDAETGGKRVIDYLVGYELIQDEPSKPDAHARIDELLKRVESLESERKGVADVILSHGEELEQITKLHERIMERVRSTESLLDNVSDRLTRIDGRGLIPR